MKVGTNIRRAAVVASVTALGAMAGMPGAARADDGPIVGITLPVTVCGVQIGVGGTAAGDCPNTPQQAPSVSVNLDPITSGEILAPVTGIIENPGAAAGVVTGVVENPTAILDPNVVGGVVNGGDTVIGVDAPVTACGNAVAVGTDVSAGCPDSLPPSTPSGATVDTNIAVDVCGNGVGVLAPSAGSCATDPAGGGADGNAVGLPAGLGDVVPAGDVLDTTGTLIGGGRPIDLPSILNDLGLGNLLGASVQADVCGNGAGVAEGATGACPLAVPPDPTTPTTVTPTTPTTTPGATTTVPGATTPGGTAATTTTPGGSPAATTVPGAGGGSGGGSGGASSGGSMLPTTGAGVLTMLGLASLLAGTGVIVRRIGRTRRTLPA